MALIKWIDGLREIAGDYDAFLIDAWGVLHDGITPFDGAIDALTALRGEGKSVVIVSNASRRTSEVAREMADLGIGRDLYAHLVTSGEATWQALSTRPDDRHAGLGDRCFYLGPKRSQSLMNGLGLHEVEQIKEASFFLVAGVVEPDDTLEPYRTLLADAKALDLVLVAANSDRIAVSGGKPYFCGGALADIYTDMGGTCFHYGKPHPTIYETCFERVPGTPRNRILAIGDSFDTDMPGAHSAGIDALFISGGIHAEELADNSATQLDRLCDKAGCRPRSAMDLFRW